MAESIGTPLRWAADFPWIAYNAQKSRCVSG